MTLLGQTLRGGYERSINDAVSGCEDKVHVSHQLNTYDMEATRFCIFV